MRLYTHDPISEENGLIHWKTNVAKFTFYNYKYNLTVHEKVGRCLDVQPWLGGTPLQDDHQSWLGYWAKEMLPYWVIFIQLLELPERNIEIAAGTHADDIEGKQGLV